MRCALLHMAEHFNDWDLQALVRSCATVAHPDHPPPPPEPATAPRGARAKAEAEAAPAPEPTTPAAPRGEAPTRAAAPVAAQGQERAPPVVAAALLYDLEYLDLDHKPFLLPVTTQAPRGARGAADDGREREVMISFPAAAASTSGGMQQRAVPPGRKAGARTPRPKRSKKSQLKKVVREMPVADGGASSSDPWAWRKYGQKPIKGSPYPRGYYKCSSMKGCMARKLVERSPAKPGVLIVTYMAEHCHPVPTQLNALAGTTRHKSASASGAATEDNNAASSSPRSHEQGPAAERAAGGEHDSNEASTATALEFGGEEMAALDDENELWPAGMDLDELLAPVDDDFDFKRVVDDGDGVLGRRLSL
ncbi:WRKY transcription factor 22 [Dichanthelium oligosanthes]|uniref:WRKY transcription factor 22 n=1 Tax=Dichanthelium oligosanthes TaxID=888268 RepID=A0A1E5UWP3_9POAL|nr:WRKY transcription factor 22 [Dichanthelium oligosanthes]